MAATALLDVKGLQMYFPVHHSGGEMVRAVDGISFRLERGESLGLVGESGCGKTTTGRCIVRLEQPTTGSILFEGVDLCKLHGEPLRRVRRRLQMIFQDPYASLDPRHTIEAALAEPLQLHHLVSGKAAQRVRVVELLERVGLSATALDRYPHEFSGGQRQRIGIARALAVEPACIVADEPVSALDLSIRAQILSLLQDVQEAFGLTYLFISHDLSVVRQLCSQVAVMYLGKLVEIASREALFTQPRHPYTKALLSAVPIADPHRERQRQRIILSGDLPSPTHPPSGCRFHTRCPFAQARCREEEPLLRLVGEVGHLVACHYAEQMS